MMGDAIGAGATAKSWSQQRIEGGSGAVVMSCRSRSEVRAATRNLNLQHRRRHRTPKGPGPVSAVRSAPNHSQLGRGMTRDTTPQGTSNRQRHEDRGCGGARAPVCFVHYPIVSHVSTTPWDACLACGEGRDSQNKTEKTSPKKRHRWGRFRSKRACACGEGSGSATESSTESGAVAHAGGQHGGAPRRGLANQVPESSPRGVNRGNAAGGTSSWEVEPKHSCVGLRLFHSSAGSTCRPVGQWRPGARKRFLDAGRARTLIATSSRPGEQELCARPTYQRDCCTASS